MFSDANEVKNDLAARIVQALEDRERSGVDVTPGNVVGFVVADFGLSVEDAETALAMTRLAPMLGRDHPARRRAAALPDPAARGEAPLTPPPTPDE